MHVSDFGIASASGLDTLTLPGTVLGTAGYLSPEQARGEPATPASDRYSLGVVAFELLTGRRPFAADTPTTEAFAHLNADVPRPRRRRPALPPRRGRRAPAGPREGPDVAAGERRGARRGAPRFVRGRTLAGPRRRSSSGRTRRRAASRSSQVEALSGAAVALLASGVLAAGFVLAVLVGAGRRARRPDRTADVSLRPRASPTTDHARRRRRPPSPQVDGAALNDAGVRARAGGRLRRRATDPAGSRRRAERVELDHRGVRELQPRVRPLRRRALRRCRRAPRPLGANPGRARRDRRPAQRMGEPLRSDEAATVGATARAREGAEGRGRRSGRSKLRLGRSSRTISPSSGKRPIDCFEYTSSSSASTSNCDFAPGFAVASMSSSRELGCETRSPCVVAASGGAVEDLDPHGGHSSQIVLNCSNGWRQSSQ